MCCCLFSALSSTFLPLCPAAHLPFWVQCAKPNLPTAFSSSHPVPGSGSRQKGWNSSAEAVVPRELFGHLGVTRNMHSFGQCDRDPSGVAPTSEFCSGGFSCFFPFQCPLLPSPSSCLSIPANSGMSIPV